MSTEEQMIAAGGQKPEAEPTEEWVRQESELELRLKELANKELAELRHPLYTFSTQHSQPRIIPPSLNLTEESLDQIRAIVREELAALKASENVQTPVSVNHVSNSPYPKELQEKFLRMGYGSWAPTPGVEDEDREIYLTINGEHLHIMSVEEALALSDDELRQRLDAVLIHNGMYPVDESEAK